MDTSKQLKADSAYPIQVFGTNRKNDAIVFSSDFMTVVHRIMPSYHHQYQADLFLKYTTDFIRRLPSEFKNFNDNFYEVETYLHKYFQWSNN